MKNRITLLLLFAFFAVLPTGRAQQYARISPTFTDFTTWHDLFGIGDEVTLVGYFNRDSRADIVAFTRGQLGDVFVALSDGGSFQGTGDKWNDMFSVSGEIPVIPHRGGDRILTFNLANGDVWEARAEHQPGKAAFPPCPDAADCNRHNGFSQGVKVLTRFCITGQTPQAADFDGDGYFDLVCFLKSSYSASPQGDVNVAIRPVVMGKMD